MPEESTVSEKHIPPPGFSLASIRIHPDSGQLRGHANTGCLPRNRTLTIWPVQAKLAINKPGDRYEEEADRVAEQVMRMPEPRIVNRSEMAQPPLMRRSCPKCSKSVSERKDEEERLQMKPASWTTPKSSAAQAMPSSAPSLVHEALRTPGQQLDASTRAFMEPRFAYDFGQVRVHTDAQAAEAARVMNARAFTIGQGIVFGEGQYDTVSNSGKYLLAHELAHTVQQTKRSFMSNHWGQQIIRLVLRNQSVQKEIKEDVAPVQGDEMVEDEQSHGDPRGVAASAREQAANGLDIALERLDEAISNMENSEPIPNDVLSALERFFPGDSPEFLPLLRRRINSIRSIVETVRIRYIYRQLPYSSDPEAFVINPILESGITPAAAFPLPPGSPEYILVFPSFYRERDLQATRLIHECFHLYYPFIRHASRGREGPRADAFAYQGFVSILSGLYQAIPLERFPEPETEGDEEASSQPDADDEERLQMKSVSGAGPERRLAQATPSSVPPIVHEVLRSPGRPLDAATRAFMEPRFGHDFSNVRVHTDARAAESAQAVNALAYTVGNDIVLGVGPYAPGKTIGKQLLAHELTHTIQQSQDNLLQEDHGSLVVCKPGDSYETEAETQALSADKEDIFAPICAQSQIGIKRKQTSLQRIELEPIEVTGVACQCDPATEQNYDYETFRYITSIEPLITSIASRRNVPAAAVAGAIADEYNGRRGLRAYLDDIQDALIGSLPEFAIDLDRFFDFHERLLNTLENDIGRANINVRTALQLVQSGELTIPGSPPSDIQVNRIIDYLLTERGMVEATTAVIARALRLFSPHLGEHGEELREAIFVEYFKQGDTYFNRFLRSLALDPAHKICPGEGGCRYLFNRDRILTALHPFNIQLQYDVGTMAPHVSRGDR